MTRNKRKTRKPRKTRKMRGGGIRFDGTWKAEPGIKSPDRLAYSNAEASFLNYMRIGRLQNELTWYGNIDAVTGAFLALDTGNIMAATTQEEMRIGGYTAMLNAIGSLTNAIAGRNRKDEDFKKVDTITEIDDRGRQTQRPLTDEEKERHRYRTRVLQTVLDALNEAKKPYDEKYNSFVKPKKAPTEKPTLDFTALPVEEGVDLPADNTPSPPPQIKSRVKDTSTFEEQLAQGQADAEDRCEGCGKTETVVRAETGKGLNICSRCKSVKYCGPVCQKACWKEHKPFCIPSLPALPPLDYVATLPYYVEDIRSLVFLNHDEFVCYAITKTQLLVFTNAFNLYMGPYVGIVKEADVEKEGEKEKRIDIKDNEFDRKAEAIARKLRTKQLSKEGVQEELMQHVHESNQEEHRPVLTPDELERIRIEGQKAKSTPFTENTIIKKYKEKVDALTRDISATNENMDTLLTYLDSQTNPFIKSELARLKVKYGSLQRTDALVEDIKTMLIETQKKLAQASVDTLLERIEEFYKVKRALKKATELYETEKAKYQKRIHDYENLTEIGIPLHSPTGLLRIGNDVIITMDHFMYDVNRGLKIGKKKGTREGNTQLCQLDHPTDMAIDNTRTIVVCVDSGNHLLVFYNRKHNIVQFMPPSDSPKPGYINDAYGRDIRSWRFNSPKGITIYKDCFFVADTGNDCIRRIQEVGGGVLQLTTIAGRQPGEKDSILNEPMSVCMLGDSIIVADTGNHCIRKLTKKGDGSYKMDVIAGTPGKAGYKNGRDSLFSSPCKVVVRDGNIYVADRGNSRIRVIVDHDPRPGEFPKNLIV